MRYNGENCVQSLWTYLETKDFKLVNGQSLNLDLQEVNVANLQLIIAEVV